jgi:biopolymer transport protein TolR
VPGPDHSKLARKAANRRRLRHRRQSHGHAVGSSAAKSEINVTPFVDVVLVLLIIFMVVTPMLQRGINVVLPLTDHHADKKDTGEQIIISVRRDGAIFLGRDAVGLRALETRLRALLRRQPPPPVYIKGDKRIKFKPVREIMEVCHRVGATAASLTTQARKGGS